MACIADPAAVEARRQEVVAAREAFALALGRAGFACSPSRANFVLAATGLDDLALFEAMVRRGFLIRPGSEFGMPGRVRITVGPSELMARVVDAMVEARDEIRDRPSR
jgi:histidinol-phosphate aminotransferase